MNLAQKSAKNTKSFLHYRIFFAVLFLIELPLIIYAAVLYVAEYSQKKNEIFNTNKFIANQVKRNIEEDFNLKQQVLNLVLDEINFKKGDVNNFLVNIVKQFNLQSLFYATHQNDSLIIRNASKEQNIGKNVDAIKDILSNKTALFKSMNLKCSDCVYFSRAVFEDEKPVGAIVLSVLQKDFLGFSKNELPLNLEISITDPQKKVIVSTNQKYKYLDPIDNTDKIITKNSVNDNAYFLITAVGNQNMRLAHLKSYFVKHGLILGITFFSLLLATLLLITILAKPIDELLKVMRGVKGGKVKTRYKEHKMGFEINYLGTVFNEMMDSLIYHQHEIEQAKIDRLQYLQEIKIAEDIQLSLLLDKELTTKHLDLAFGNIYAKEVGGDFYDFIEKDKKVFFVMADVATKGIEACLYALTLRSIIRSLATTMSDLGDIILNSNKLFIKCSAKNNMFATAFFGLYDVTAKKLQYCNCGHMPAILRKKDGKIQFLKTPGGALGIEKFDQVQINQIILQKKDLLFLYTDGVIDAIDMNNKFFGENKLLEFIKITHDLKANEIVESLFYNLKLYSKDAPQYDDATVMAIKII